MSDDIKIGLSVDDTNGSVGKRAEETKALRKELDKVTKSANEASDALKQLASAQAASSTHAMGGSRAAAKAAKTVTSMDDTDVTDYRRAKGIANATGAGARDFAREAQGLGGLVHLYATFAANIFAVGAAYSLLDKAFSNERMEKAADMMSIKLGTNIKGIAKDLLVATDHAISFQEAIQFTNVGTAAGLTGKQIQNLTVIAKGAANALGRDMGDSVRRMIQGTAKQEQEILDELGIFVRANTAYKEYAAKIGASGADALTAEQRVQAYADAVAKAGEKWREFSTIEDPFSRFTASAKEAGQSILGSIAGPLSKVLGMLAESKPLIEGLMLVGLAKLGTMAMPHISSQIQGAISTPHDDIKKFKLDQETRVAAMVAEEKAIQEKVILAKRAVRDEYASIAPEGASIKRTASRMASDPGAIGHIGTPEALRKAAEAEIIHNIKVKDVKLAQSNLDKAKAADLVWQNSTLDKITVKASALNAIEKDALAVQAKATALRAEQLKLMASMQAVDQHARLAITEETHKSLAPSWISKQLGEGFAKQSNTNKERAASRANQIDVDLGSASLSTADKAVSIFSNLGGIIGDSEGKLGKLAGTFRAFGTAASLALRGIMASMPYLLAAFTAWEMILRPIAYSLGIFNDRLDAVKTATEQSTETTKLAGEALDKLNGIYSRSNLELSDYVEAGKVRSNVVNGAIEDTNKLIDAQVALATEKNKKGKLVASDSAIVSGQRDIEEALTTKVEQLHSKGILVGSEYNKALSAINNAKDATIRLDKGIISAEESSAKFTSSLSLIPNILRDGQVEASKFNDKLQESLGFAKGIEKNLQALTKAKENAQDVSLPKMKSEHARGVYTESKGAIGAIERDQISLQEQNAAIAKSSGATKTRLELDRAATLSAISSNIKSIEDARSALAKQAAKDTKGFVVPVAVKLSVVSSKDDLTKFLDDIAKAGIGITSGKGSVAEGPDVELKRLEMKAKLASQELTLQNLSMSNAEKLGTINSKEAIHDKYKLEVTLARAQYEKDIHQIEKEKTGDMGAQKALAEKILQGKITELGITERIANEQARIAESAKLHSLVQQRDQESLAQGSVANAKGLVSTEVLQAEKDRIRIEEAAFKVAQANRKTDKTDYNAAVSAQKILGSTLELEKVLAKQVSERNTLSNQAFVYNEYMKKAIEEGATLSDYTSFEITNREIILKTMEAQLIIARQYSGEEKASYLAKLRLETDIKLKDDEKLKRRLALKDLEREIDSSDRSKVTKDRVLAVAADEAFTRYEDFRNKMRGVITGTFDAVYKGMDTAIDSLTTKMMKGQKVTARDLLRDFGNAAAEEFRQMSADRMKLAFRTTVSGVLGGSAADDARKAEREKAERPIALAQEGNGYLKQLVEYAAQTATTTASISDNTVDPAKPASPAIIAAEAAKAKAVNKLATSEFVGPPAPAATGWTDAGSTKNSLGNAGIGALSGLLMAQMSGSNNKLAPWISAIGGGLLSGLMGQKGGIMGMFSNKFADGGIMTSAGSIPLNKYANGGVATSPQLALFGEGKMNEAYVPLPDGRTIPVSMKSPVGGGVINSSSQTNQVTVHVNPTTGTTNTSASGMDPAMMQQLGNSIGAKVREELMFQKRPGGLLY